MTEIYCRPPVATIPYAAHSLSSRNTPFAITLRATSLPKRHLQIARDNIITLECSTLYPCVYVQGVPPEFTQSRISRVSRDSEILFFVL